MQGVIKGMVCAAALWMSGQVLALDVNSADVATLSAELVGVGEKTAQAIVDERSANGKFKDAADLSARVKGVGDKTIEKNRDKLEFK